MSATMVGMTLDVCAVNKEGKKMLMSFVEFLTATEKCVLHNPLISGEKVRGGKVVFCDFCESSGLHTDNQQK
jgi:hypothetical protein